ncbi:hypothetical protein F511_12670 [Dorcoceras hygrometricum]|uniref:Uncharacterized protein n=1 Tax=Dorcoceras hygrometricum TaxID=472368 RepID=A0A2Z7B6I4_9LAMI|nr:hypothetical protein F511_12670 [Dorcoceras hygrometricum]
MLVQEGLPPAATATTKSRARRKATYAAATSAVLHRVIVRRLVASNQQVVGHHTCNRAQINSSRSATSRPPIARPARDVKKLIARRERPLCAASAHISATVQQLRRATKRGQRAGFRARRAMMRVHMCTAGIGAAAHGGGRRPTSKF